MFRNCLAALLVASLAAPAFAEEDPRVTEALKGLPTDAEINEIMDDMPDFNRMMTGMIEIAQDKETHATLDRLATRLEDRFDPEAFTQADSELSDLNAMMESVMGLASDRESMADILTLAFKVQDVLVDATDMPAGDTETPELR